MESIPYKMTYDGVTIWLNPQVPSCVPQWQRLTTHWSNFRVGEKTLFFPSEGEAYAFAKLLLKKWEERGCKETWKDVRTQVCQEFVALQHCSPD